MTSLTPVAAADDLPIVFKCSVCGETLKFGVAEGVPAELRPAVAELAMQDFLPTIGWSVLMNTVKLRVELLCSEVCKAGAVEDMNKARSLQRSVGAGPGGQAKKLIVP